MGRKHMVERGGIPTLSLFSGAGGLDIGFLKSGFDIKACVEINKTYSSTLEANVGGAEGYGADAVIHNEDVTEFDTSPYHDLGIECVIGGPPCQTFSAAGRRSGGVLGTEDERGRLFLAYCRILKELQPKVFVFENVYGLPGANGGKPWAEITAAFSELGYQLRAEVVDAADYGVPQHRERLILVGYRTGQFRFPLPTHGPDSVEGRPLVSVESAIEDLQDPSEPYHDHLGGMYGHLLPLVPEGLNYAYFTAEMNHPEPVFAWRSKFHDLLYKVDRRSPCRTIKAQPGKFTGPFHWKNRHFTTAELKRLQSFPDDYKIVGTSGKVLEQIGNSVPPLLAEVIAVSVREQLLESSNELTYATRPDGFVSTFRNRQRERSGHFVEVAAAAIAKQYGTGAVSAKLLSENKPSSSYFLAPKTLYDRQHYDDAPRTTTKSYAVDILEDGRHINVSVSKRGVKGSKMSRVDISGLAKYLPDFDSLRLIAHVDHIEDLFHCWGVIEEALTSRSRFFTIIDIYGHYANRGDTVDISSHWEIPAEDHVRSLLNLFASTTGCGVFKSMAHICKSLSISGEEFAEAVAQLRAVRFDVRTSVSHPIIKGDSVLCTYPFPLLSPRAMVTSKAQIVNLERAEASTLASDGVHASGR